MFDLKVINAVLQEMEEERGIPREKMIDAIEQSLATAYKKEFGKRGQIITAKFDLAAGTTIFNQIKIVVDESMLKPELADDEEAEEEEEDAVVGGEKKVRFDEEKHIMLSTARMIKKDAQTGEELIFPLEPKDDFGRIAAQTAKQVIVQKIREAEKDAALAEFGQKAGEVTYSASNEVIFTSISVASPLSCLTTNKFQANATNRENVCALSCWRLKKLHAVSFLSCHDLILIFSLVYLLLKLPNYKVVRWK